MAKNKYKAGDQVDYRFRDGWKQGVIAEVVRRSNGQYFYLIKDITAIFPPREDRNQIMLEEELKLPPPDEVHKEHSIQKHNDFYRGESVEFLRVRVGTLERWRPAMIRQFFPLENGKAFYKIQDQSLDIPIDEDKIKVVGSDQVRKTLNPDIHPYAVSESHGSHAFAVYSRDQFVEYLTRSGDWHSGIIYDVLRSMTFDELLGGPFYYIVKDISRDLPKEERIFLPVWESRIRQPKYTTADILFYSHNRMAGVGGF